MNAIAFGRQRKQWYLLSAAVSVNSPAIKAWGVGKKWEDPVKVLTPTPYTIHLLPLTSCLPYLCGK